MNKITVDLRVKILGLELAIDDRTLVEMTSCHNRAMGKINVEEAQEIRLINRYGAFASSQAVDISNALKSRIE